jgi:hypothetical protein
MIEFVFECIGDCKVNFGKQDFKTMANTHAQGNGFVKFYPLDDSNMRSWYKAPFSAQFGFRFAYIKSQDNAILTWDNNIHHLSEVCAESNGKIVIGNYSRPTINKINIRNGKVNIEHNVIKKENNKFSLEIGKLVLQDNALFKFKIGGVKYSLSTNQNENLEIDYPFKLIKIKEFIEGKINSSDSNLILNNDVEEYGVRNKEVFKRFMQQNSTIGKDELNSIFATSEENSICLYDQLFPQISSLYGEIDNYSCSII